jgi:hypothetical protein
VAGVDHELDSYIQSKQDSQFEKRKAEELNWIIKYTWLKESQPTDESSRYHFSSVADRFRNLCYKLTDNGEIKGYLHLTIRDNHLKIPYVYFEPEYLHDIVEYIYQIMEEYKLNMLTVFHPDLVTFFKSNTTRFIYKRDIRRHYIITKALDIHFKEKEKLIIQDGDADCAFT